MLADVVRTDRHLHRSPAGDTELAEALKVLARTHQRLVWARQHHLNILRHTLREFYPAALVAFGHDLDNRDGLQVLLKAPTPRQARALSLSKIEAALRRGGRMRGITIRAEQIQRALRTDQLEQSSALVADAFGVTVKTNVEVIVAIAKQLAEVEKELTTHFEQHPDAEIILSLPGLGIVLGARVLGEFGDDPNRHADAKSRKNYAGTSPITRASGLKRIVLARYARNKRIADACYFWAFTSLTKSPGAKRYYDAHRSRGQTHHQALRATANRWVGILHGCISHRQKYDESIAWQQENHVAA